MRADAQRRRDEIVVQAKRLFAAHGGDIALDVIAERSQVGIATLYRNFPSREDLVIAVAEDLVERIRSAVEHARPVLEVDPVRAWTGLIGELVDLDLGALTGAFGARDGVGSPSRAWRVQQPALEALDELLDELRRRGTVREGLTALEVVVSIATLTRPLPGPIRREAPSVRHHLVQAYLSWSLGGL